MKIPTISWLDNPEQKSRLAIFLALFLLTLAVRFPFFFLSVIDWDESTYILMGQSIVDGNFPYLEFWEAKPPLAFVPYAVFIWLFGDSIVGIRLGGAVCVSVTAYIAFRLGQHMWGRAAGVISAVILVIFVSFLRGGQSTLTELITIVPLMGAAALCVIGKEGPRKYFLLGGIISLAALVRLELAYFALFLGGFFLIKSAMKKNYPVNYFFLYALGGLIPVGLVILVYWVGGHARIFFDSAVIAPYKFAETQLSFLPTLWALAGNLFSTSKALLWGGFLGAIFLNVIKWNMNTETQKQGAVILGVFFLGVAFAISKTGAGFGHHLIQVVGFLALFSGQFYAFLFNRYNKLLISMIIFSGLMAFASILLYAYMDIGYRLLNHQPLQSDTGYKIADYMRKENPGREPVYLTKYHIVYWLNQMKPMRKVVHPANISEDIFNKVLFGPEASSQSEVIRLLEKKPRFIVKEMNTWYLEKKPKTKAILDQALYTDYVMVKKIDDAFIFKRKDF